MLKLLPATHIFTKGSIIVFGPYGEIDSDLYVKKLPSSTQRPRVQTDIVYEVVGGAATFNSFDGTVTKKMEVGDKVFSPQEPYAPTATTRRAMERARIKFYSDN